MILLVYLSYKTIGTRVKVIDIYNDINSKEEAELEYYSVRSALKTYKNKWILELSTNRLKACLMWLIDNYVGGKISSINWDIEDFKRTIELLWKEKLLFYDNKLILEGVDDVIEESDIKDIPKELRIYLLFIKYIIPY